MMFMVKAQNINSAPRITAIIFKIGQDRCPSIVELPYFRYLNHCIATSWTTSLATPLLNCIISHPWVPNFTSNSQSKTKVRAGQPLMDEVSMQLSSCAQLYAVLVVASGRSAARRTGFVWVPPLLFTSHYKYLTIHCAWLCVIVGKKYVIQCAVRGCIPPKIVRRNVCLFIGFRREEMLSNDGLKLARIPTCRG